MSCFNCKHLTSINCKLDRNSACPYDWISVKDKLPNPFNVVIWCQKYENMKVPRIASMENQTFEEFEKQFIGKITHWRILPHLPPEDDNAD